MPTGVATDQEGNIFVADTGAQRIREVTKNGSVLTIAGSGALSVTGLWVRGGYSDGPATSAQFNHPSSIAVGPSGTLYVADMLNHCIRKIEKGRVTTFAGNAGAAGNNDGIAAQATFEFPRSLAFDAAGALFVADSSVGIRKITPDGRVATINLPKDFNTVFGAVVVPESTTVGLVISNSDSIIALDKTLRVLWRQRVAPRLTGLFDAAGTLYGRAVTEANIPISSAFAMTYSNQTLFYTDLQTHSIRSLALDGDSASARILSAPPIPDAGDFGGNFLDGPLAQAQFDSPMGISSLRDGTLIIADSGNRRIRSFPASQSSAEVLPNANLPSLPASDPGQRSVVFLDTQKLPNPRDISLNYYRIAFIGNSFAFWNTRWDDSIEGLIERRLNAERRKIKIAKPVKIIAINPFRNLPVTEDYVANVLSQGIVDTVILQLNEGTVLTTFPWDGNNFPSYCAMWQPSFFQSIRRMNRTLRSSHTRFIVVINPYYAELTPLENAFSDEFLGAYGTPGSAYNTWQKYPLHNPLHDVVHKSGVAFLDLFETFVESERSAGRRPLYGTVDQHFSAAGRALVAKSISEYLEHSKPWN